MSNIVNELHQEIVKLEAEAKVLLDKYGPAFGLHKTRLGSAQTDKESYLRLGHDIYNLRRVLSYYGYSTSGPNLNLYKDI